MGKSGTKKPAATTPASFCIRVQGYLDNSWADQLGGMNFTNHHGSSQATETVLSGQLIDQAELMGVLNQLHGLGFRLLSVERLETGQ